MARQLQVLTNNCLNNNRKTAKNKIEIIEI